MRYIVSIYILFFLLACGNQDFDKMDIRLLNSKKSVIEKSDNNTKELEPQKVEEESQKLELQNSSSEIKPLKSIEKDEEMPIVKSKEENIEIDSNSSISISTIESDINDSIVVVSKEINRTTPKSEKVLLAELDAKAKSEALAMQSQYSISLKKLEANNRKLLTDKELALAKIENQKEIEKKRIADKKELSLLEIKSKERLALAKLSSKKELSKSQKELNQEKAINDKEVALAELETQKVISQNSSKTALQKAQSDKEIALAELANQKELTDKNIAFYKMIAIAITALLVLGLLIVYFINRKKRTNELKMHQDELRHKEYMEASRQHNEHVKKMLDIITDESADKAVKKEVIRLLKEQGKKGNLIEHRDKSLMFFIF